MEINKLKIMFTSKEMASYGGIQFTRSFEEKTKRVTVNSANMRNEFVAAIAERVFVAYDALGSKTESFCKKILQWDKPLFTFDAPENKALLEMGAKTFVI